jgi:hypothetical protein
MLWRLRGRGIYAPALPSCLYSPKFLVIEFYEVRVLGILRSSLPIRHQCLKIRNLSDTLLYLMGVRYIRIMDR